MTIEQRLAGLSVSTANSPAGTDDKKRSAPQPVLQKVQARVVEPSQWTTLPSEAFMNLLYPMDFAEIAAVRRVCKGWRDSCGDSLQILQPSTLHPKLPTMFPQLTMLRIPATMMRTLPTVTALQSLHTLHVWGSHQAGDNNVHLEPLLDFRALITLSFDRVTVVCTQGAERVLAQLPRLRSVALSRSSPINARHLRPQVYSEAAAPRDPWKPTFIDLLGGCTALQNLDISGTKVSNVELQGLLGEMSRLQTLQLGSCRALTAEGFTAIGKLRGLTQLDVSYCPGMSDAALPSLAMLRHLSSLNLQHCWKVTDAGLPALQSLSALLELDLSCCPVTPLGIRALAALPALKKINLGFTGWEEPEEERTTLLDVVEALEGFPSLQTFGFHQRYGRDGLPEAPPMPTLEWYTIPRAKQLLTAERPLGICIGTVEEQ